MQNNIESHLVEKRVFKPLRDFAKNARIKSLGQYRRMYRESIRQPAKFWAREASELGWRAHGSAWCTRLSSADLAPTAFVIALWTAAPSRSSLPTAPIAAAALCR